MPVEDAKKNLIEVPWLEQQFLAEVTSVFGGARIVETSYRRLGLLVQFVPLLNLQALCMQHLNHFNQTLQSTLFVQQWKV